MGVNYQIRKSKRYINKTMRCLAESLTNVISRRFLNKGFTEVEVRGPDKLHILLGSVTHNLLSQTNLGSTL